jgi:hypothetical protein
VGRTAAITVATREIASTATITAATAKPQGNLRWEQRDDNTCQHGNDFFHDVSLSGSFYFTVF